MGMFRAMFGKQRGSGPKLTDGGPIQVNITSEQIKAPSSKHALMGGDHWWRMHIDISMSRQDFALYTRSGLIENELFAYPHPDYPDTLISFAGMTIGYMLYVDFPSMQDLQAAKEDLFTGLQIVRSQLERMKGTDDPHKESVEI